MEVSGNTGKSSVPYHLNGCVEYNGQTYISLKEMVRLCWKFARRQGSDIALALEGSTVPKDGEFPKLIKEISFLDRITSLVMRS